MPKLSPTMEFGTVIRWHKQVGDFVAEGDLLLEISSDKSVMEFTASEEGWLRHRFIEDGGKLKVGTPLALFTSKPTDPFELPSASPPTAVSKKPLDPEQARVETSLPATGHVVSLFSPEPPLKDVQTRTFGKKTAVPSSPLAKKLASKRGIDLRKVVGSGPQGAVVAKDVERAPGGRYRTPASPELPPGSYEYISRSPIQMATGSRLQEAKSSIPHFYVSLEVEVSALKRLHEELKSGGISFTYNDYILLATARALQEHPEMNRGFDGKKNEVIQFQTIDIAIAVALPNGLITPILRHADFKSLEEISQEVKELIDKAKAGSLKREEYMGGSFTISNLGMWGVSQFTAIINPPQAAILAVSGIKTQPVVSAAQTLQVGHCLNLTISADHRVLDGTMVARF